MKLSPLNRRGLLDLLLWLPLAAQAGFLLAGILILFVGGLLFKRISDGVGAALSISFLFITGALILALCIRCGFRLVALRASITEGSQGLVYRYQPLMLACGYTFVFALIGLLVPIPDDDAVFGRFATIFGLSHCTSTLFFYGVGWFTGISPWFFLAPPVLIYLAYGAGMILAYHKKGFPRLSRMRWAMFVAVLAIATGTIVTRAIYLRAQVMVTRSVYPERNQEWRVTSAYQPFSEDNKLVPVPNPGFSISSDYPRVDGATATFPVYAAAAQAIYEGVPRGQMDDFVETSKTPNAYDLLIKGEVDIIFVAQPSAQQRADAEAAGKTLRLTPLARDAFVFFVNERNPVNGLTTAQVRDIYKKTITKWSAVGGSDQKIMAFQRPAGSGSQTALEQMVMRGENLAKAPREEVILSMGGILQRVAMYQNSEYAIGYSFRYYATRMNPIEGVKLLTIDGVAPTPENIRSGAYPYTVDFYAVTAGTTNPHAQKFIDWFLLPVGQKLIDDTGYVGLSR